ncbi:phosphoribosylglycinamide synthetase C domain-containing protein [Janibacter melonis]|uniref:phosphoribosylglycinamide synthetase C domain-containing protein n=1 Tax=Janibacter melonis TaxID=262209 RepID=UPI0035564E46
MTVVVAAAGYPASPSTGDPIGGLELVGDTDTYVLHAGTAAGPDGTVVSAGGRVLSVVSSAPTSARRASMRTPASRRSSSRAATTAPTSRCAPPAGDPHPADRSPLAPAPSPRRPGTPRRARSSSVTPVVAGPRRPGLVDDERVSCQEEPTRWPRRPRRARGGRRRRRRRRRGPVVVRVRRDECPAAGRREGGADGGGERRGGVDLALPLSWCELDGAHAERVRRDTHAERAHAPPDHRGASPIAPRASRSGPVAPAAMSSRPARNRWTALVRSRTASPLATLEPRAQHTPVTARLVPASRGPVPWTSTRSSGR